MTGSGRTPGDDDPEAFRAERLTKAYGRYIIYYSWPESADSPGDRRDAAPRSQEPAQRPWSPETQPADADGTPPTSDSRG